ncbi:Na+/H+ antiporter subunit A [Pseudalkalibacillus hwajinpoensis]|uniref:Na+/H+ antiporter subunit A n=1 Tax=Guptibacillus hwajinpoensis TaxID=208199 RepID=UPI001CD76E0C|nr:Na+/H+ antiporter subunit A [Pseudalkalibacillus hwajinpoensis]MCA0992856.1 Na+/H+ antiporter subunit A [Pseudalkalibacillus hwajinpoensis]
MLHAAVLLPFLAAFFIPLLYRGVKQVHLGWFVLLVPILLFGYFLTFIQGVMQGVHTLKTFEWIPSLGVNVTFYIDGLGLFFALLITGIGSLVVLYSIYYLSKAEKLGHFYVYLLLFMGAMLGVVLSDNLFVLYTFWELTSISSFLLIGYWYQREKSTSGALKSMMITVFGGLAMLGGFILMADITGTASIRGIIENGEMIVNSTLFPFILILVLLGAFTKSAQFPFHTWLPDAMEAPTPVSAFLHSATMVKAGIYLVARLSLIFAGTDLFFLIVSGFGLLTLCWGSYMAVTQTDLKAILAYSTISQLGMIMAMLGFGTELAILAAVFHILNHATFKGSLFMVAGIIDHETGTRDIRKLGGLFTFMPITATLAFFGTFSMAGFPLPFLNGFLSKEMFFDSSLHFENASTIVEAVSPFFPYFAVGGSIFTFVYSIMLFFRTFTGKQRETLPKQPHEAPIGMLISPIVLVLLVIIIAFIPDAFGHALLSPMVDAINGSVGETHIKFWHGFGPALYMSLAVLILGSALYLTREKWQHVYKALPGKLSAAKAYDSLINGLINGSRKLTNVYMTGSLRHYMIYIFVFFIALVGITMSVTGGFQINFDDLAPIAIPEVMIAIVMAGAAIATIFMKNRIAAILVLGIVGYGLSLLFVFFRAPDLALTQLIVETVTVALFLLCFYHLPNFDKKKESKSTNAVNWVISISVGVLVTMVGIASHSTKLFEPISDYFLKNSYKLGGGDNVVNVILVDFRGLDTMLEILVLGLAALGIYTMIKLRPGKKEGND